MEGSKIFTIWHRAPHLVRLLLAVVLIQLIFWLLIKPAVIGAPNPGFDTIDGYEYSEAALDAPDYAAVEQAQFEPISEMPAWHCCAPGYRAFRYQFDLEAIPENGLGIDAHVRADNFKIYVNGVFVAGSGRMELSDHTYDNLFRKIHHIPSKVITLGRNQVTFIMVRNGIPYFDYFKPILGEYTEISANMERTVFLSEGYSYLIIAAIAMVALFSLIFFLISGRESGALWLFLLAASFAITSHYYVWTDPPFGGQTRIAYFFVISLFSQFAWFGWADSWSRDNYRWTLPAALIAFGLALAASLYCLAFQDYGPGYDNAGEIVFYCGIAFAIATAMRLLWNFRDLQEDRYWEAAIALLLVALLALQAITEMTQALNMGYTSRTAPFLIIGVAIGFFARRVTLFRSGAQINALLQSQLDERTSELAIAHTREKRLVRQQALDEERQRIMRDMHDGLGSHLMSMMMMAKRGQGKHADFADGLQSVIDEMRLMIDSMDSVGESLRVALTVYKKRIVPRAKEAGFTVTWNDEATAPLPNYNPREVLQVFRILQEALTNALKHSGGDAISVSVEPASADSSSTRIVVADNGNGIEAAPGSGPKAGRGLKNMRVRAAAIGAGLEIAPIGGGTAVFLTLVAKK